MNEFDYYWNFKKKIFQEDFKEKLSDLNNDSSWKIFFPISICFLSFVYKNKIFIEKISGASIINRFPLKIMLPISTKKISGRHLDKSYIIDNLKNFDHVSVNLLSQNFSKCINFDDKFKNSISEAHKITNKNSVIKKSSISFCWTKKNLKNIKISKLKSHSLVFLDIEKILINNHLKKNKILWQSLPKYNGKNDFNFIINKNQKYYKGFTDKYLYQTNFKNLNYRKIKNKKEFTEIFLKKFKSKNIKKLNPEEAKWPIFFPSSVGIVGSKINNHNFNFMPCGSTTVVNRFPFQFATSISHLNYNIRYRKRFSLSAILKNKKITLGIPFSNKEVLKMINYMGNVSKFDYDEKISNTIFKKKLSKYGPVLKDLPVTYGCILNDKINFLTHTLLIFEVKKIFFSKKFNNKKLKWNGLFKLIKK